MVWNMGVGLFDAFKADTVWAVGFGRGGGENSLSDLFWAYWWPLKVLFIRLGRGFKFCDC
jgi:hypothetical protein